MKLTIVSSSPRPQSISHRVASYLSNAIKEKNEEIELTFLDLRDWLNKFNHDQKVYQNLESVPENLKELGEIIFGSDAFIFVSPEYNGSYPYSLKMVFDHFPKQISKSFGIVTSSPGAFGGMRCALALQHYIIALFGNLCPQMLVIPFVDKKFDENNQLIDENFQQSIDNFLNSFTKHIYAYSELTELKNI